MKIGDLERYVGTGLLAIIVPLAAGCATAPLERITWQDSYVNGAGIKMYPYEARVRSKIGPKELAPKLQREIDIPITDRFSIGFEFEEKY